MSAVSNLGKSEGEGVQGKVRHSAVDMATQLLPAFGIFHSFIRGTKTNHSGTRLSFSLFIVFFGKLFVVNWRAARPVLLGLPDGSLAWVDGCQSASVTSRACCWC